MRAYTFKRFYERLSLLETLCENRHAFQSLPEGSCKGETLELDRECEGRAGEAAGVGSLMFEVHGLQGEVESFLWVTAA